MEYFTQSQLSQVITNDLRSAKVLSHMDIGQMTWVAEFRNTISAILRVSQNVAMPRGSTHQRRFVITSDPMSDWIGTALGATRGERTQRGDLCPSERTLSMTTVVTNGPLRPTSPVTETLIGLSFGDHFRAQEFLTATRRLQSHEKLLLKDAVLVTQTPEGKAKVIETVDPQPKRTALSGAMWSGLIGLIVAGPVGWAAGLAVGAGAGVVTARIVDLGVPDDWVEWFSEVAKPGRTTLALLVSHLDRDAFVAEVARFDDIRLVHANLDDDTLARVHLAIAKLSPVETSAPVTE